MGFVRSGYAPKIDYLVNKSPQAGAPLTAGMMSEIAKATEGLGVSRNRNVHHHYFDDPSTAPTGIVTTAPGTAAFSTDSTSGATSTFMLPMYVRNHADTITARLTMALVSTSQSRVLLRVNTQTLVDSVATVNGEWTQIHTRSGIQPGSGRWAFDGFGGNWVFSRVNLSVAPTVPANRRVAVTFDVRFESPSGSEWAPANSERKIKIAYMTLFDTLPPQPPVEP